MSLITIRDRRLKLEAVIGIIYAVASAATVMLISKTPHGDSDIQEVLFGNILSVNWGKITIVGIIFGVIGLVHLIFYKKFFLLTETFENNDSNAAATIFRENKWFKFWNFIFYISIGLAIVFAVRTSGVIPVFSFLIIPSVAAIMLCRKNLHITIAAIIMSLLAAYLGLFVSYHYDFPAGSSIVVVLGALFLIASIFYLFKSKKKEKPVE